MHVLSDAELISSIHLFKIDPSCLLNIFLIRKVSIFSNQVIKRDCSVFVDFNAVVVFAVNNESNRMY